MFIVILSSGSQVSKNCGKRLKKKGRPVSRKNEEKKKDVWCLSFSKRQSFQTPTRSVCFSIKWVIVGVILSLIELEWFVKEKEKSPYLIFLKCVPCSRLDQTCSRNLLLWPCFDEMTCFEMTWCGCELLLLKGVEMSMEREDVRNRGGSGRESEMN